MAWGDGLRKLGLVSLGCLHMCIDLSGNGVKGVWFNEGPAAPFDVLWRNRHLIFALAQREFLARYRSNIFGVLWSLLVPLTMLVIYTIVFAYIFPSRWASSAMQLQKENVFPLLLFSGLLLFALFAEPVTRAPRLVLDNANYVMNMRFPVEIFPWVAVCAAVINFLLGNAVFFLVYFFIIGLPPVTSLFLPLVAFPILLFAVGISWLLASLGVYFRDVGQIVGPVTSALIFLSPVFYPIGALPEKFRFLFYFNPLTPVLEMAKDCIFWGRLPDFPVLIFYIMLGWMVAWLGYNWFRKTQEGFADVI